MEVGRSELGLGWKRAGGVCVGVDVALMSERPQELVQMMREYRRGCVLAWGEVMSVKGRNGPSKKSSFVKPSRKAEVATSTSTGAIRRAGTD